MTQPLPPPTATLQLDERDMRELGYRVVDSIVEHYSTLRARPVSKISTREDLRKQLLEPIPQHGSEPGAVLEFVTREVLSNTMATDHPRFFGFVPGPSNFIGAMADALASGYNTIVTNWMEASGPAMLELVTIDWLRKLCGLPEGAGGLFVSGGSVANLTALAVAREVKLAGDMTGAVVYSSDQTHASNNKALKILGFRADQHRAVSTDDNFRLDPLVLSALVARDRADGRRPFCVIANAGTTNTGAVDPLTELVDIGASNDLWIHVDGAFGAAAILTKRGARWLHGLGDVDSLSIDPHKWLFQPFEIGCVLVKHANQLKRTFAEDHVYMQDVDSPAHSREVNFSDHGVQLTRGFRALKLWMSLKIFGLDQFRDAIDHTLDLAQCAERLLRERSNVQVCTPARMGVVTFRYLPPELGEEETDEFNLALVQALVKQGFAMLTSTQLRKRTVLRFCTINPRTTEEDLVGTLEVLDQLYTDQLS